MMKQERVLKAAILVVCLIVPFNIFGATYIKDAVLDPFYVDWYQGAAGAFKLTSSAAGLDDFAIIFGGAFDTISGGDPEYILHINEDEFIFGLIETSEILMYNDVTAQNGGMAKAYFGPAGTMSIYGTLLRYSDMTVVADGSLGLTPLIEAQISSPEWFMVEETPNIVTARIDFEVTGGLLSDALLNLDGLVMPDFWSLFTFQGVTPSIVDFENFSGTYFSQNVDLQLGAVPEPMSILLLGLGGLVLTRRGRNI